jgi:methionine-rich copper-binding protein CopC
MRLPLTKTDSPKKTRHEGAYAFAHRFPCGGNLGCPCMEDEPWGQIMKSLRRIALIAFVAMPVLALAHTHLKESTPADGAVIARAPSSITLTFSEPTRLTALALEEGGSERKLGPLPTAASEKIEVPAPELGPGAYTLKWRAVGKDSHVMSGAIRFTISADGTESSGRPAEHKPHAH